jgi:N-acetylglucosaminyl-diphospho-decaprenol L-rhamnosyltransferase
MSSLTPDVAIVIVTYNSRALIADLLDSISGALDGATAEVVVVDNNSRDGTADYVAQRDDCMLVRSANVGYAAGINRGVMEAQKAGAILALNPDVIFRRGSIPPMLRALRRENTGIVVPQVRGGEGDLSMSLRREPSILRSLGLTATRLSVFSEYINKRSLYASPRIVDWALGAAILMSRECYDSLVGWDESYFLYSEETDLCLRARDKGFLTVYEPSSVVVHIGGQSGRDHRTHSMRCINRVRLYRRRHGVIAAWCFLVLTAAFELRWALRGRRESWTAVRALARPEQRPIELKCSDTLMPR